MEQERQFEYKPCDTCTHKNGYGGENRCYSCELSVRRREQEELLRKIEKLKKDLERKKKGENKNALF